MNSDEIPTIESGQNGQNSTTTNEKKEASPANPAESTKPADTQQQAKPDPRTSPANDAETTKMAELVENNTQQVVQSPAVNGAEIPTVTELTENQGHAFAENPHDEEVDSHAKSPSIPPEDQCGISHDSIASSDRKANESSDNSQYFISPKTNGSESNSNEPRRRSTRDIKRPKFDDELVESIHIAPPKVAQRRRQSSEKLTSNPPLEEEQLRMQIKKKNTIRNVGEENDSNRSAKEETLATTTKQTRKRKMTTVDGEASNKTHKMKKLHQQLNEFGEPIEWPPEDDIALVAAVTHVSDLWIVYSQMHFTRRYTLEQIEERWHQLLYNEQASQVARKRMEQVSKEKISAIQSKLPFSMGEEHLISNLPANIQLPLRPQLEKMLELHMDVFHYSRTPKVLEEHWRELKAAWLLVDQRTPNHALTEEEKSIEHNYDLYSLSALGSSSEQLPLDVEERQFARSIGISEREAKDWEKVVVKTVTGVLPNNPVMGPETVAIFHGRCTTFDIRKEKVLIGRSTKRHNVEVNLTLEGPTARISRKQAIFKLTDKGDYQLRNIGKRDISVNGEIVLQGEAKPLTKNSIIEIAGIKLKFLKNDNYRRVNTETGGHGQASVGIEQKQAQEVPTTNT